MRSATPLLARRDFLCGAASLLGGSALGLLPSFAEATVGTDAVSVGFVEGDRVVDATSLRAGDVPTDHVLLSVAGSGLDAIEAHAPVPGYGRVPFVLWVAPPGGMSRSRVRVATDRDGGLVLGVFVKGQRHEVALADGVGKGAKLREGTYVLAPGKATWGAFGHEDGKVVSFRSTPHVVLTVERA